MRGNAAAVQTLAALSPQDCWISSVTVYELEVGVGKCAVPAREQARLQALLSVVGVADFNTDAAREAANIRVELERLGSSIGPYDLLIAGHARALGATLVTDNLNEFRRVPSLRVQQW
jgi:tRNA(fMet)-specific endonuclease VapC